MARTRPVSRNALKRRTPYVAIADRPATTVTHPLIDLARERGIDPLASVTARGIPQVEIVCRRGYVTLRPGSTVVSTANVVPQEMLDARDFEGIFGVIDGKANGRSCLKHPDGWSVHSMAGPHLTVEPVAIAA